MCYPFVGDSVGGAQLSVLTLVNHLPRHIGATIVLHEEGPLSGLLRGDGVDFTPLPLADIAGRHPAPARQILALARSVPAVARFLRRNRIDIVHTQDGRMHASWGLAARLCGVKHVWHQRSLYAPSRLQDHVIRHAGRVIANSRAAAQSLPAGQRERAVVLPNPVEPSASRPAVRDFRADILAAAGCEASSRPLVIASVGNLREVKRPLLQAETAAEAARLAGRPVVLALLGEDREEWVPRMRDFLQRSGQPSRLACLGFRHPVSDWLAACDVLLAASGGDAFGRSLVEAMASGVPVVAAAAGGHVEIVTDGKDGLLTEDGSATAMANAIARIAKDAALRTRLIAGGRERAAAFAPQAHAAAMSEIYHGLVS